jgi:hypothetical protein
MANLLYRTSASATTPTSTTVKNAPLTNLEVDGNFKSINDDLANKPTLVGGGASGTWGISISGNAATVTNGVYTTATYPNPAWITSLDVVKLTGTAANPGWITSLDVVKLTGTIADPSWITSLAGSKVTNAVLITGSYANPAWITSLNETKVLPTQTGNAGRLLTTNGTSTSWSTNLTYDSGTGTLTTTNFNSTSDIVLKNNINNVMDATSIVNQLRGVEFEWKDNGKKSAGVIAQELENILPHLVDQSVDGIKNVNYAGLTAYLIESIKELSARLYKLENQ